MAKVKSKYGICTCCVNSVKWFPVLFIVCIVVWSYYAYVVQLCLFTVRSIIEKVVYLIFYHLFLSVFLWSYWQTIFTEIGHIPRQFHLSPADVEKLESFAGLDEQSRYLEYLVRELPVSCRTFTGAVRYCEKCQVIKPDRAHHCSVCGECVLKMDHHCPWVNNCVAFTNYKFFVLFLGYSLLYCIYISATTASYFILFWKDELPGLGRFHILFLFFVAVMFAISLLSLFSYHIYLVLMNRSTLESFRSPMFRTGPDKKGFFLGKYNNFAEVFGVDRRLWFLPISTSTGDGITFPKAPHLLQPPVSYNSTVSQPNNTSMGDGIHFPQRCVDEDTDQLLGGRQRWAEDTPDVEELTHVVVTNELHAV